MLMVADDLHNEHAMENQLHLAVSADPGLCADQSPSDDQFMLARNDHCMLPTFGWSSDWQVILLDDCLVKQLSGFL